MEKIENIKSLLNTITSSETKNRSDVINLLSKEFKVKPATVESNWICKGYYPERHLDAIIQLFQNLIYSEKLA